MQYEIKRGNTVIATVTPTGKRSKKIMDINIVDMTFSLPESVDFTVGDYCMGYGERYALKNLNDLDKKSRREFEYTLNLKGRAYDLRSRAYLGLDGQNHLTVGSFSVTGNAETLIDLLIQNANRNDSGWVKGVIDVTAVDTFTFQEGDNCLSVLSTLADRFKTEWWVDGETIHLTKKGIVQDITLQHGKGNGLYNIKRTTVQDKQLITRLYAFGSTDNIPGDYRNYSKNLKLPGVDYIERNVDKYGVIEGVVVFDDIKPEFNGKVDAVTDEFTFTDSAIDFNINLQQLPDVKLKVNFLSGQLAGYSFELGHYDPATKTVTILTNADEKSITVPSALLKPAPGDQYNFTDIIMPQSYITDAENRLLSAAQDYLSQFSNPNVTYTVTCDPNNFRLRGIVLSLGDYIRVVDSDFNLDKNIRLGAFDQDLQDAYSYPAVDLSEIISIPQDVKFINAYEKLKASVSVNNLTSALAARRNAKNLVELKELVIDPDGNYFTDKIKPRSVETLYLSVGAVATNFSLNKVSFESNYNGDPNAFAATPGELIHYDFKIAGSGFVWQMADYLITGLTPASTYYLYAKIAKTSLNGVWELSTEVKTVESVAGYYILQAGILFAVKDGRRDNQITKGMVFIVGDQITAGRLKSIDERMYIDLTTGQLQLGDNTSGLDWNVSAPNRLTIKGSLFQSGSGVVAPLPVYRGAYNNTPTYYKGDSVFYGGSTWIYVNEVSGAGHTPADNEYWDLLAQAGAKGSDGINGLNGTNGTPGPAGTATYFHVAYADAADGSVNFNQNGGKYIGTYVDSTPADSNDYHTYKWVLLKGADGANGTSGIAGQNGADGRTSYLHIKYSNDGGSTFTANVGESPGSYLGQYVDFTLADSNDPGAYTWALIRATDGNHGNDGANGNYTEFRFQKNGSTTSPPSLQNTNADPPGWSIQQPGVGIGEYLWLTSALKSGATNGLLTNWSTPVRTSAADGANGQNGSNGTNGSNGAAGTTGATGATGAQGAQGPGGAQGPQGPIGPLLSYTGNYDNSRAYTGSQTRIEAVKYGGNYYFSRVDAGTFSGVLPTDSSKWNQAGAVFDSVATGLLLASAATVENLTVRYVATSPTGKRVIIDGTANNLLFFDGNGTEVIRLDDNSAIEYTTIQVNDYPNPPTIVKHYGPGFRVGPAVGRSTQMSRTAFSTVDDNTDLRNYIGDGTVQLDAYKGFYVSDNPGGLNLQKGKSVVVQYKDQTGANKRQLFVAGILINENY